MVHKYNTRKWRCTRRFQYAKGWTGGADFCKANRLTPPKRHAALAQLVEHIIRNDGVGCSNHPSGTISSIKSTGYEDYENNPCNQFCSIVFYSWLLSSCVEPV
jgi:hypothetical protein